MSRPGLPCVGRAARATAGLLSCRHERAGGAPHLQRDREHRTGPSADPDARCLTATVLVVDDGSPDGTATSPRRSARSWATSRCMRRHEKSGLGSAYRAGFRWGLDDGFDACVEMDADLSHEPEALPGLRGCPRRGCEVVIGLAVRARGRRSPTGPGTAACSPGAATCMPSALLGLGVADSTAGLPGLRRLGAPPHRPRSDQGRGVRVPDRDDLSGQAGRGRHRRGPDPVRRPGGRRVQDVHVHRGRGLRAGDLVGGAAAGRACGSDPSPTHA